jgi:hypothetical protein
MTELREVLDFIQNDATESDLNSIYEMGKIRTRSLRTQQAALIASTVKPGDKVRLSGLSPKYLNGEVAKVVSVEGSKLAIQFEYYIGKFAPEQTVRVPASCTTVVTEESA